MLFQSLDQTIEQARRRLGLEADAPLSELQGAFQRALKAERVGGDHVPAEAYREILDAYKVLREVASDGQPTTDARRFEDWPSHIELTPEEAILGGMKVGRLPTGRPFETKLPASLRDGDLVWVWGWLLQVRVDDIWITVRRRPRELRAGARITVESPLGACSFGLSDAAVEQGLVRAPGFGLPPSRGHAQGDLYVKLIADAGQGGPVELLRRLTPRRAA